MRQFMMILLTALSLSTCKAHTHCRCLSGIDLSDILRQHRVRLFSGIPVNDRWSVSADVSLLVPHISSEELDRHLEDLGVGGSENRRDSSDLIKAGISAQYWIKETFLGPFLSFGVESSHRINISCPMMIGHMCQIWKGMKIMTAYDLELISSFQQKKICGEGIRLGICYEF